MKRQELLDLNTSYRSGESKISDKEFDKLVETYIEETKDTSILEELQKVPVISNKVKLPISMYSLNEEKTLDSLNKWTNERAIVVTPKFDGISFVKWGDDIATRGDGEFGESLNRHFPNLNKVHDFAQYGECIMKKKVFEEKYKGKEVNGKIYKTARNMVAGILNTLDAEKVKDVVKDIDLVYYGASLINKPTNLDKLEIFETLTQNTNKLIVSKGILLNTTLTQEFLNELFLKWGNEYQLDGLVIELNNKLLRESRETNNNPTYARKYKQFEAQEEETTIKNIRIQVSKQGFQKPVLDIEEINLGGVDVTSVTAINTSYLIDMALFEGQTIKIKRSGDVIPKIVQVGEYRIPFRDQFKTEKEYRIEKDLTVKMLELAFEKETRELMDSEKLNFCPECGTATKWNETMVETVCSNEDCKGRRISEMVDFITILGIEEVGEPTVKTLFENGIDNFFKLFVMTKDLLININGFAEVSINDILSRFRNIRVPLARLLHASNCFISLGEKKLQLILDNIVFDQNEDWEMDLLNISINDLKQIKGIEEKTANYFKQGIEKFFSKNYDILPIEIEFISSPKVKATSNKYEGFKVCFTGFRDKGLENDIVNGGGEIVSGVSSKTTHLIVSSKEDNSSKLKKAREINCPILLVSEFLSL